MAANHQRVFTLGGGCATTAAIQRRQLTSLGASIVAATVIPGTPYFIGATLHPNHQGQSGIHIIRPNIRATVAISSRSKRHGFGNKKSTEPVESLIEIITNQYAAD
ncbi:MAG: hypothetical protein M0036_05505 [Desulfobacteraceae bacterium]|nr:hypothetical protein [Desulfobacteraceae bacterium]